MLITSIQVCIFNMLQQQLSRTPWRDGVVNFSKNVSSIQHSHTSTGSSIYPSAGVSTRIVITIMLFTSQSEDLQNLKLKLYSNADLLIRILTLCTLVFECALVQGTMSICILSMADYAHSIVTLSQRMIHMGSRLCMNNQWG